MRARLGGRPVALIAVLMGAVLAAPEVVGADGLSPSISPARIQVDTPIRQGQIVQLPGLSVSNRGAEAARYEVAVVAVADDESLPVPASWVRLQPATFELGGGEAIVVGVWLEVPGDATAGNYRARLRAMATSSAAEGGTAVSVRAAVASDLRFTVVEHEERALEPVVTWVERHAALLGISIGVFSGTLLMLEARDRFRVRIQRREREG